MITLLQVGLMASGALMLVSMVAVIVGVGKARAPLTPAVATASAVISFVIAMTCFAAVGAVR